MPEHRLTLHEIVVYYASIKYFLNQLPAEVREEQSYSKFSFRLKELLTYNFIHNSNGFDTLCKSLRQTI